MALRDGALDVANRARDAVIVSSEEHLLSLLNEVLDLSRIEAGHMELRLRTFSLGELLCSIADTSRARATETRLKFRCSLDPLLSDTGRGDALRLRQALDNLLGNAFKFTTRGGA